MTIKFGTDGWRAIMGREFTLENVQRVAQAFADHLNEPAEPAASARAKRVAIGYDRRRDSENFARAFAEILVGNGIETQLASDACTTPAVSYRIVSEKLDAGIIVTASHNPPDYNGIKIKNEFGGSADRAVTDSVERRLFKSPVRKTPLDGPLAKTVDFNARYLDYLRSYVRIDAIRESPYRVLVDSMHGAGDAHLERLLSGGRVRVETIRSERDVTFGGVSPEPIPKNLSGAIELMKTGHYDLCVVTDGDADRVGALRPGGEFVSPGTILSLILIHFVEDLRRTGSVVTTVSNTGLIYRVARKFELQVHETPVGFKYICEIMRRENVLIGGEESGGIGFQNYLYERDGVLSGLLLLEMMAMRGRGFEAILNEVEREFGKLYYVRRDIDYPNELKAGLFERLSSNPPASLERHAVARVQSQDGRKFVLDDGSWLLFRLSGTEPILRIYSEATSPELAERLVERGREIAFSTTA